MHSVMPISEPAPSRRAVVRGAVTAAWAVPAIAVVAAAPAYAISGVTVPNLRGLSETSSGLTRTLRVSIPLVYDASSAFPVGSVVTVTVTDPSAILSGAPTTGTTPTGWRASTPVNSPAGSRAWRVTFTTTAAEPTVPLVVTFAKLSLTAFRNANPTVTVTVAPVGKPATTHLLTWP